MSALIENFMVIKEDEEDFYGFDRNKSGWAFIMPVVSKIMDIVEKPMDETFSELTKHFESIWNDEDLVSASELWISKYDRKEL